MTRSVSKYLVLTLFFLIFIDYSAFSQLHTKSKKAIGHYNTALSNYNLLDYEGTKEEIEAALDKDSDFIEAYLLKSEVYTDLKDYAVAIESYKNVIRLDPDFFPSAFYNAGRLMVLTGNYEEASDYLQQFLSKNVSVESLIQKANKNLKICEFAREAMDNPVEFNPRNIGPQVNSVYDEYWPSITADNQTLVITRLEPIVTQGIRSTGRKSENFYVSKFENGGWTKAVELGPPINTDRNEGAQSLSADGHFMYYTSCNRPDGFGRCDIYFSSKLRGTWSFPENIGKPINSGAWEAQPSISADGRSLYFVSNRPGGIGKMDIWKSIMQDDGNWGEPINLGKEVNSPDNEMSPFIHRDNQTLYFSSDGWTGMGGYDLFVSRIGQDSLWTEPKNLGYPINSWSDEIGMIVTTEGNKAYYSSAVGDTTGKDIFEFDLYTEIRPEPVSYFKGNVYDSKTGKPLYAIFLLIDLDTEETVMQAFSDRDGEFLVCLPTNRNYALNVSREGYLFYSRNFALKGITEISDPYLMDVPLHPIKVGEKEVLRNIFFEYDSYELLQESIVELNELVKFLNINMGLEIEIQGHTDDIGAPDYNQNLSERRARAVYQYLLDNSISKKRLSFKGFGETQPIAGNESEADRAMNRRIEFVVKKVGSKR